MEKLIICDNKYCQLITSNPSLMSLARKFLSYKTPGVEFTVAYQNGWNGINYLIDKKGYFYSGLYDKVKKFLQENEVEFVEEDKRKSVTFSKEIDLLPKLTSLNMIPRDYQTDILEAAMNNAKGIIRAGTGAGKSVCIAMVTAKINKPTVIYVIGLDLLKQFHDLFSQLFDEKIGFIGNGVCDIQRINIASIWTIGRSLKMDKKQIINDEDIAEEKELDPSQYEKISNMLKLSKLHIFDESHVASTDTIKIIYKNIDPERIYGFSGTPFRDDNTNLLIHGILGEQIIDISASELIRKKVLAKPIIKFVAVPKVRLNNSIYTSVYKEYIVENEIRNNMIVKEVQNMIEKKYTPLILFKQIKHGEILFEKMKEQGIKCAILHGNDSLDIRTEIKDQVNSGELQAIICSVIFDLGLNLPILSGLVLAGGGQSSIRALQRIGRVIRGYPGKSYAAVVDFYDQAKFLKQHSLKRCQVYESEPEFIIKKPKEMI